MSNCPHVTAGLVIMCLFNTALTRGVSALCNHTDGLKNIKLIIELFIEEKKHIFIAYFRLGWIEFWLFSVRIGTRNVRAPHRS